MIQAILVYFSRLKEMECIKQLEIVKITDNDIRVEIGVILDDYIVPIRASIEANFYTDKSLGIKMVRSVNEKRINAVSIFNDTIVVEIKVIKNVEVDYEYV